MLNVVVIGSGCAGLSAAYHLKKCEAEGLVRVTLYEADDRLGGHANAVKVGDVLVDTGFMVYNTRNYPYMLKMFEELGVEGIPTSMGFSVSMDQSRFEWCADTLAGLFATPSNAVNPQFYLMLRDIFRFNTKAKEILALPRDDPTLQLTVGAFLTKFGFSTAFSKYYLVPMTGAIWSSSSTGIMDFPILALFTFLDNHLLLQTSRNLQWMTPLNRSREYVDKIAAFLGPDSVVLKKQVVAVRRDPSKATGGVVVVDAQGEETVFDRVVFACHPDQAADMLRGDKGASDDLNVLSNFKYSTNDTYVHSDPALMPASKAAWTSWNYKESTSLTSPVYVTYWLNQLQALKTDKQIFVSLNPSPPPQPHLVHQRISYAHPQYTQASVAAQKVVMQRQGLNHTFFAGAWLGYGFHEDGVRSGFVAAELLSGRPTGWTIVYPDSEKKTTTVGKMTMKRDHWLPSWASGPLLRGLERLSKRVLFHVLGKGFRQGRLSFVGADGAPIKALGPGGASGAELTVRVRDERFFSRVALEYDLGLCRSFIAGEWELKDMGADYQGLTEFFNLLMLNTYTVGRKQSSQSVANIAISQLPTAWIGSLLNSIAYFAFMDNSVANSRSHIHAHYDLSNDLFSSFLDEETMMYSCGVFEERYDETTGKLVLSGSLAEAQERKIDALLQRLQLSAHHTLLDIGFGWGGIAIAAAGKYGCRVHGITLSVEQKALAEERVRARGLSHLITFELCDYRVFAKSGRTFDRIVSCEMIEAVGHKYLPSFFSAVDALLALDGIFVMQAITMPDSRYPLYKKSADFCNTVIFP